MKALPPSVGRMGVVARFCSTCAWALLLLMGSPAALGDEYVAGRVLNAHTGFPIRGIDIDVLSGNGRTVEDDAAAMLNQRGGGDIGQRHATGGDLRWIEDRFLYVGGEGDG